METKKCSKCKMEKPLSEFQPDKSKKSGYKSQCKLCIKNNPNRINYMKEYREKYKVENHERLQELHANYRERHREKLKQYSREYYETRKNDDEFKKKQRERARVYYASHKNEKREYQRQYRKTERGKAVNLLTKAKRRGLIADGDSSINLKELFERDNGICGICGKPCNWSDYTIQDGAIVVGYDYPSVDHIIPLNKGGSHTWDNVQLAHKYCNSYKSDREM